VFFLERRDGLQLFGLCGRESVEIWIIYVPIINIIVISYEQTNENNKNNVNKNVPIQYNTHVMRNDGLFVSLLSYGL